MYKMSIGILCEFSLKSWPWNSLYIFLWSLLLLDQLSLDVIHIIKVWFNSFLENFPYDSTICFLLFAYYVTNIRIIFFSSVYVYILIFYMIKINYEYTEEL